MSSRPKGRLDLADAAECGFLAGAYGLTPDDWQQWVIDGWLARRKSTGRLAASRCGLAVPRQNGKNAILEAVELFKVVVQGRRVLHTAHEVKTARKAFLRLCSFFENERKYPELAALVKDIRRTNGQEAIFLLNGGSVEFIARSKGSGRGFTVDDLVCDEAQELGDDALAALYPTISAAPSGDPQLILTGTPPSPQMTSDVFRRFRASGSAGKDARLCWDEWSAVPGADLDSLDVAASVNPALGIRLGIDVIRDERAAMDDETYARERLGVWDEDDGSGGFFTSGKWAEGATYDSQIVGDVALGIAVSWDRKRSTIGAAGFNADGRLHLEPIESFIGVEGVVEAAARLAEKHNAVAVVIDGGGPGADLVEKLTETVPQLVVMTLEDAKIACSSIYDRVEAGDQHAHLNDPDLNEAVKGAVQRTIGDRFVIGRRKSSRDVTPLEAVTFAAWGLANAADYDIADSIY